MSAIAGRTARDLLEDLAGKRVSARELLADAVATGDGVHAALNAVVATDLDRAHRAAAAVDDARARGVELGPLAGLPMTIKEGYDFAGLPATAGNPALVGRPADCADADVVAAVRGAGAVPWGKTNVPLMLGDLQSYNAVYGTTNNPYDLTRTPGGSSGGAAAALAAGITSLEIGSDIGGSLRTPAGFCGVYALKTTWNTLSMRGQVPPVPGAPEGVVDDLGVAGPMARNAGDLRLLYEVLSGRPTTPRPVDGLRVALWIDEPEFALSGEVRSVIERAGEALRSHGVIVELATPAVAGARLLDTYFGSLFPIIASGLPADVRTQLAAARPDALAAVAAGASRYGPQANVAFLTADAARIRTLRERRAAMRAEIGEWFGRWDAVLAPITPVPAFTHRHQGTLADRVIEVDDAEVPYMHLLDWIALATTLHLPALAAPAGRTAAGLPVGVQLIASWHAEDRLLDLAATLEHAVGPLPEPALQGVVPQ